MYVKRGCDIGGRRGEAGENLCVYMSVFLGTYLHTEYTPFSPKNPRPQKRFYGSVTRADDGMPPLTPACRVPPPYRRNVYLR